jgi:predicted dehydrogenase
MTTAANKKFASERYLVVGFGSIGSRHVGNLRALRPKSRIGILRRSAGDRTERPPVGADEVFYSFEQAMSFAPVAAIIANPAPFHFETASKLAQANVPILVEKPLAADLSQAIELVEVCRRFSVALAVGYNLRFLPGLQWVRDALRENLIGNVFLASAEVGQYLPDWRPSTDYRTGISAQAALGGGVLLELSHEIDYLVWLFGLPARITAVGGHSGQLEADVEDCVHLTFQYDSPWRLITLQVDFLQRIPVRCCHLSGTKGRLSWDILKDRVIVQQLGKSKTVLGNTCRNEDTNLMYIHELHNFLTAVETNKQPACSGRDGINVLAVVEAARRSLADRGKAVLLGDILP